MLHFPHDLDAALAAQEFAWRARRGDPRLLERACARRMGGAGIRRGLRGPGRRLGRIIYSAQPGYSIDLDPSNGVTHLSPNVTSWVDQAQALDDYIQAIDGARPEFIASHANLGGQPAVFVDVSNVEFMREAAITARAETSWTFYVVGDFIDITPATFLLDIQTGRMILLAPYQSKVGLFDTAARIAAGTISAGPQVLVTRVTAGASASESWTNTSSLGTFTATPTAMSGAAGLFANFAGTGAGAWGDAYLGRLLGYSQAHTPATRGAITAQLMSDYL